MVTWDQLRQNIDGLAAKDGEWSGYPMPIPRHGLVVEPRHPWAERINGFKLESDDDEPPAPEPEKPMTVRNRWWSFLKNGWLHVVEQDGKVDAFVDYEGLPSRRFRMAFNTLGVGASPAWSIEAELNAQIKLRELIGDHKFKCYLTTGMFVESSKRSNVSYIFRRLRPTVAIRDERILCCLCLHPIGYYEDTWAGVMVPTDCVIAHVMLMRSDEHGFWKKANQHPAWVPQAGL